MTRRSKAIKEGGDGIGYVAEMSQALAARYGIKQGDFIKAWSRYGYIVIKADVIDIVCGGVIRFYCYRESRYSELTGNDRVIGKSSTLKAAVQIRRIRSICELKRFMS